MQGKIRQWGRPLREIDESKGKPMASQTKDTFDDIAISLEKNEFCEPVNSIFKRTVSRQQREQV